MGGVGRGRFQRVDQDGLDHVVADRASRARAGGVGQPLEPVDGEAAAPLGHRDRVDFELSGDLGVSTTVRRSQHYAGTQRQHLG